MCALKLKAGQMSQIKSETDNNNVENPPAGFISHEIFQHVTPIKGYPAYTQLL
jgi:hypothetical protein